MKNFNADKFQNDVQNSLDYVLKEIQELYNSNLESIFSDVVKVFNDCIDRHAPFKKALRRRCKLIKKPWVTKDIFVSTRRKQKLYVMYYLNGLLSQKSYYKRYANKLTKVKCLSKKNSPT